MSKYLTNTAKMLAGEAIQIIKIVPCIGKYETVSGTKKISVYKKPRISKKKGIKKNNAATNRRIRILEIYKSEELFIKKLITLAKSSYNFKKVKSLSASERGHLYSYFGKRKKLKKIKKQLTEYCASPNTVKLDLSWFGIGTKTATNTKRKARTKRVRITKRKVSGYIDYLNSDRWLDTRNTYRESGFNARSCWACGSLKRINLHHRTYVRIGKEKFKDILPLCNVCHQKVRKIEKNGDKPCTIKHKMIERETKLLNMPFSDWCDINLSAELTKILDKSIL